MARRLKKCRCHTFALSRPVRPMQLSLFFFFLVYFIFYLFFIFFFWGGERNGVLCHCYLGSVSRQLRGVFAYLVYEMALREGVTASLAEANAWLKGGHDTFHVPCYQGRNWIPRISGSWVIVYLTQYSTDTNEIGVHLSIITRVQDFS